MTSSCDVTLVAVLQVFESYVMDYTYESTQYTLVLHDTAGNDDYDRLRTPTYSGTRVFLLCYSLADKAHFEHIRSKVIHDVEAN